MALKTLLKTFLDMLLLNSTRRDTKCPKGLRNTLGILERAGEKSRTLGPALAFQDSPAKNTRNQTQPAAAQQLHACIACFKNFPEADEAGWKGGCKGVARAALYCGSPCGHLVTFAHPGCPPRPNQKSPLSKKNPTRARETRNEPIPNPQPKTT